MKRAIVKVTKAALAAAFAPGGKIMGVREKDEDFQNNTISLDVEADWCPEVKEGEPLSVVTAPAPHSLEAAEQAIRDYRHGK